jgi:hypothetical protein
MKLFLCIIFLINIFLVGFSEARKFSQEEVFWAYPTHGINGFNGRKLVDFSMVTTMGFVNMATPLLEVCAYNSGGSECTSVSATTNKNLPLATTLSAASVFNPPSVDSIRARGLHNRPVNQIGVQKMVASSLSDRVVPTVFENSAPHTVSWAKGYRSLPTVGDWEKARGRISIVCNEQGGADLVLKAKNLVPKGVYTLWEVGGMNVMTPNEMFMGLPGGGVPNVVLADEFGTARHRASLPHCPTKPCSMGDTCTFYYSLTFHWDGMVYGGGPGADFYAVDPMGVGVLGSNHLWIPIRGEMMVRPPTFSDDSFRP